MCIGGFRVMVVRGGGGGVRASVTLQLPGRACGKHVCWNVTLGCGNR